jgi:hypothetical protein
MATFWPIGSFTHSWVILVFFLGVIVAFMPDAPEAKIIDFLKIKL